MYYQLLKDSQLVASPGCNQVDPGKTVYYSSYESLLHKSELLGPNYAWLSGSGAPQARQLKVTDCFCANGRELFPKAILLRKLGSLVRGLEQSREEMRTVRRWYSREQSCLGHA